MTTANKRVASVPKYVRYELICIDRCKRAYCKKHIPLGLCPIADRLITPLDVSVRNRKKRRRTPAQVRGIILQIVMLAIVVAAIGLTLSGGLKRQKQEPVKVPIHEMRAYESEYLQGRVEAAK